MYLRRPLETLFVQHIIDSAKTSTQTHAEGVRCHEYHERILNARLAFNIQEMNTYTHT